MSRQKCITNGVTGQLASLASGLHSFITDKSPSQSAAAAPRPRRRQTDTHPTSACSPRPRPSPAGSILRAYSPRTRPAISPAVIASPEPIGLMASTLGGRADHRRIARGEQRALLAQRQHGPIGTPLAQRVERGDLILRRHQSAPQQRLGLGQIDLDDAGAAVTPCLSPSPELSSSVGRPRRAPRDQLRDECGSRRRPARCRRDRPRWPPGKQASNRRRNWACVVRGERRRSAR